MITFLMPTLGDKDKVHKICEQLQEAFVEFPNFKLCIYINSPCDLSFAASYDFECKLYNRPFNVGTLGNVIELLTHAEYDWGCLISDDDTYNFKTILTDITSAITTKNGWYKLHSAIREDIIIEKEEDLAILIDREHFPQTLLLSGYVFNKSHVLTLARELYFYASCLAPHLVLAILLVKYGNHGKIIKSNGVVPFSAPVESHWNIEYTYGSLLPNFRILLGLNHHLRKKLEFACYPRFVISPIMVGIRSSSFRECSCVSKSIFYDSWLRKYFCHLGFLIKCMVYLINIKSLNNKLQKLAQLGEIRS